MPLHAFDRNRAASARIQRLIGHFEFREASVAQLAREDALRMLEEDAGASDIAASVVGRNRRMRAQVLAREDAVLCGRPWVEAVLRQLEAQSGLAWQASEGARCAAGQVVLEITGHARTLLAAERTALGCLQRLSAVATRTAAFAEVVRDTRTQIVDSRQVLPGWRMAQKYAVRIGGGSPHRAGLHDAILIKENHVAAAGGVRAALQAAAQAATGAMFVQVEVSSLAQLDEALSHGAHMIVLNGMALPTLRDAVRRNEAALEARAVLEVADGVTLANARALADAGIDRISLGALGEDTRWADFRMRFV